MSSISRVDKLVREVAGTSSLGEAEALRQQSIGILVSGVSPDKLPLLLRPAVALALRCFRGDVLVAARRGGTTPLVESVATMEAELFGTPTRLRVCTPSFMQTAPNVLVLGPPVDGLISADASDDTAGVNWKLDAGSDRSSASAACFAVSAGFAKMFASNLLGKGVDRNESWCFCLDTFRTVAKGESQRLQEPLDLGRIMLLGAGAIGSAFAYALHLSSDTARLDVVDKDCYDEPNQETTLFLSHAEACRRQPKAQVLAACAQRLGLVATALPQQEVGPNSRLLGTALGFLICAVDNVETRRAIDLHSSKWVLNGGLGSTRSDAGWVLATRHGVGDLQLSRLYPVDHDRETETLDPQGAVGDCSRVAYEHVTLAAPFLSLACGALLLAYCRQIVRGFIPAENYLKLDLFGKQARHILKRQS